MSGLEVFLEFSRKMAELLFEMKLELYEKSSVALLERAASTAAASSSSSQSQLLLDSFVQAASLAASQAQQERRSDFLSEADMLVHALYSSLPTGFDSQTAVSAASNAEGAAAAVGEKRFDAMLYGELAPAGVAALVGEHLLPAVAQALMLRQGDSGADAGGGPLPVAFVDLGSGVGKAVMEVALSCAGLAEEQFVVSAVGVELDLERHTVASMARTLLMSSGGDEEGDEQLPDDADLSDRAPKIVRDRVLFLCQDMLLPIEPLTAPVAVFAFCCGVAFDVEMCAKIVRRVLAFEHHQFIGGVFLFREWPFKDNNNTNTGLTCPMPGWTVTKSHIATSWMNEAPCFVLRRA